MCSRQAVLRSIIVMRIVVSVGLVLVMMADVAIADMSTGSPMTPEDAAVLAREKATTAKQQFDRGDYDAAIENYREAYRLVPTSGLLYNLGQAYRLAGRCAEAADAYRRYLAHSPDSPYRATAEQNLSAADVCARDAAAASQHRVLTAEARDGDSRARRRRAGSIVAGGGGALIATGAYFALDAARAADRVSEQYERGGDWADVADDDARGRRARLVSRVTLGLGITAVAGGGALYWTGRRVDRTPSVAIGPHAGGGEVVLAWGF